jgi:transcriptional regulator NrdR family protein
MIACPVCGGSTRVTETRVVNDCARRRRHCNTEGCGGRVTTMEMPIASASRYSHDVVIVRKHDVDEILRIVQGMRVGA